MDRFKSVDIDINFKLVRIGGLRYSCLCPLPVGFQEPDPSPEGEAGCHITQVAKDEMGHPQAEVKHQGEGGWGNPTITTPAIITYMLASGDARLRLAWLTCSGSLGIESAFPGRVGVPSEAHPGPVPPGRLEASPGQVWPRCSA